LFLSLNKKCNKPANAEEKFVPVEASNLGGLPRIGDSEGQVFPRNGLWNWIVLKSATSPLTESRKLCLEWHRSWGGSPETMTWKVSFLFVVACGTGLASMISFPKVNSLKT